MPLVILEPRKDERPEVDIHALVRTASYLHLERFRGRLPASERLSREQSNSHAGD